MAILRIFINSNCSSCQRFMDQLNENAFNLGNYNVKVLDLVDRKNKPEGKKYGIKSVPSYVLKQRNTIVKQRQTAVNFKQFWSDLCN